MMCFRDRTFCTAACATTSCDRRYTAEVADSADRWWGGKRGEAPVSVDDCSARCPSFLPVAEAEPCFA